MKCKDFGSVLRTFADVLDAAGASSARDRIIAFAAVFDANPTSNVSDLLKRVASLPEARSRKSKIGGYRSPRILPKGLAPQDVQSPGAN